jgi:hypothetical protein
LKCVDFEEIKNLGEQYGYASRGFWRALIAGYWKKTKKALLVENGAEKRK